MRDDVATVLTSDAADQQSSRPATRPSGPLGGVVVTRLAEVPERTLLDERALAEALGVTKRTVRRMVARYELPPPVRFAGRSTWQAGRVLAWFEVRAERAARVAVRDATRLERLS